MNPALAQLDFATLLRLCPTINSLEGDVVFVSLAWDDQADLQAGLENIGAALFEKRIGSLENCAVDQASGCLLGFYNCPEAGLALPCIESSLRQAGMLDLARILYAKPGTNTCAQYWPAPRTAAANLAFLQNLEPEWFSRAEKLGLEFLLVTFEAPTGSPIYRHAGIETELGYALQVEGIGIYDSSLFRAGTQFHIFHIFDLPAALTVLKQEVILRGLLPITRILHRDTAAAWRVYVPPLASELAQVLPDVP